MIIKENMYMLFKYIGSIFPLAISFTHGNVFTLSFHSTRYPRDYLPQGQRRVLIPFYDPFYSTCDHMVYCC